MDALSTDREKDVSELCMEALGKFDNATATNAIIRAAKHSTNLGVILYAHG